MITFKVIGHYYEFYPKVGESVKERNKRREEEFEYTDSIKIEMVRESGRWKFSEFSLLND